MPEVTRWWWIRHAPVTGDGGCVYGQLDVSCDCSDAAALAAVAGRLPASPVLVLRRLRRTAEPAAALSFSADNLSLTRIDRLHGGAGVRWRVVGVNLGAGLLAPAAP